MLGPETIWASTKDGSWIIAAIIAKVSREQRKWYGNIFRLLETSFSELHIVMQLVIPV
jgi:hypothetical protein